MLSSSCFLACYLWGSCCNLLLNTHSHLIFDPIHFKVLPRVLIDAMEDLALMQLHTFHLCLDVLCKSKVMNLFSNSVLIPIIMLSFVDSEHNFFKLQNIDLPYLRTPNIIK